MVNETKLLPLAHPHLDVGESVLASAFGKYETHLVGQGIARNEILIATERRALFVAKRMGRS